MPRRQTLLEGAEWQPFTIALALGLGSFYLFAKVIREILHTLRPSFFPGEPETQLLASISSTTLANVTVDDMSQVIEYDYVIIGTGTAGCVLANRLSEDSSVSVLAIESGHSDLRQLFSRIPAAFGQLFRGVADWDLWTEKETECGGRKMAWPRGKMLGGCSSINAMIYNRGSPDDYDEFERLGNPGWGYRDLVKYMNKAEKFTPNKENDPGLEGPSGHGLSGPWEVGYSYVTQLSRMFLDACSANGIPIVSDLNLGKGIQGVSLFQTFISTNGQRSSAAVAYLTQAVASRPNLKIATGQTVTKIILDSSGGKPRAVGIEMAAGRLTPLRYLAKARREVILSAGAVHSPHLLKLSGIGPAEELAKHNITCVEDIRGVGCNLADHIFGTLTFASKISSLQFLLNPIKSLPALVEWLRFGTGPMTSNVAEAAAFLRTADRDDAPLSLRQNDLTSGPDSADLEILEGPLAYIDHGRHVAPTNKDWFSIGPVMLRPESRGTITLKSADPFEPPQINANYLATQHDQEMMIYGLKLSRKIARSEPFAPVFDGWYFPNKDVDDLSDKEILDHARRTCETIYHPMGTAKMGPATDPTAVVDARLKVHGVDCLRIVDASIFPKPLACHPCAPVIMVGEKAADMIKEDAGRY